MRASDGPIVKELVLVGGGHAHVAVLRAFAMRPMPGLRLTLIAREVHTPYTGMLPGYVAGHYGFDDVHIDLGPLSARAGARLYPGEAVGLDLANRLVLCADRPAVRYDLLSLNPGSTPDLAAVPGARGNVVPVKPVTGFVRHWEALLARVLASDGPLSIGAVGGGAGGAEILLAVAHRLGAELTGRGGDDGRVAFHLFAAAGEVMPDHAPATRRAMATVLAARGIAFHPGWTVDRVERGRIWSGTRLFDLDEILWVTDAAAPPWPGAAGLAVDCRGFVAVGETLASVSHPEVFAAGDAAVMAGDPRPKAGVFAVRQGPVLAANLRRALDGRRPRRFRPQRRFLGLISTGPRHAIASWGPLAVCGGWVWRWKDWIDRRFMARYNELPAMASPAPALAPLIRAAAAAEPQLAAADMRCAGCGGKVGAAILGEALRRLAPIARADVLVGLAEAGDAAIVRVPPGKVLVQSVDHFRAPIDDPYRFGRIAATHALSDLYAMGAEPQSALAIVTLPFGPAALRRDTLDQLMAGAVAALNEAGASLIGGHTGEGDLALGFAVSGLADASAATAKPRLRPGDRLVLTKRVGTGTLLAAHMRGRAKARWIEGAVGAMLTSNREAAAVLSAHGARAVTDVTGFGLAGHLLALLRGTGRHARLDLAAVPVLDGAIETARRGDLSSLHPENAEAAAAIANAEAFAADPRYALLFDPQTSGGLLAAVAPGRAEACLAALAALGPAAIIGEVERAAGGAPIRLA